MLGELESRKFNSSFREKKCKGKVQINCLQLKTNVSQYEYLPFFFVNFFASCPPSAVRGSSKYQVVHRGLSPLPCSPTYSPVDPCRCALASSSSLLPSHKALLTPAASFLLLPLFSCHLEFLLWPLKLPCTYFPKPCKYKSSSTAHKGSA